MDISIIILLIALGFLGGAVAGFLGVGGGIIFVPIYAEIISNYDIPDERIAAVVIANSACLTFFSGISGSVKQHRNNNFFLKPVLQIAASGILSSVFFSQLISNADWYDKRAFSIVFSLLLLLVILKIFRNKKSRSEIIEQAQLSVPKAIVIGIAAGAIAAFSGLGGGIVMVPLLTTWGGIALKQSTSISLGTIVLMSFSIIIYYLFFFPHRIDLPWSQGAISFSYLLALLPGVILGAPFGVSLAKRAPEKLITAIFLLFVLMVLIKTIFFA